MNTAPPTSALQTPASVRTVGTWRLELLNGELRFGRIDESGEFELRDIGTGDVQVGMLLRLATQKGLGPVPAEHLASYCYDQPYPENWKDGVAQAASRLRREREVPIAKGKYRLELKPENVDILRFEELAKSAIETLDAGGEDGVDLAVEALALWKQSPETTFADYHLLDGLFERFVRLHQRLYRVYGHHLLVNRDANARFVLAEAAELYPGNPDLQHLEEEAAALEPEATIAKTRPRRRVMHNLPTPDDTPLIGREDAVARVREVLRPYPHSQYPTITIDGVGGVGKTALAKSVAYSYLSAGEDLPADELFDAIVWTSAKKTILAERVVQQAPTLRNLNDVYSAIATTLGCTDVLAGAPDDVDRRIREILTENNRRVLLIVDNLETVDDERVLQFLRDLPAPTKSIITTRHRLDGALPLRLEGLKPADGISLAAGLAASKGLKVEASELEAIAASTSGIPLAILWTVAQIAKTSDTERVLRQLRSAAGDYAEFCFRESLSYLRDAGEREAIHLLFALSLFAESASRDGVGHVAGVNERPTDRDDALSLLTDLSLVNFSDGRYSLLPLTREFISGELGRNLDLREPAVDRWLDWHMTLTEQAAHGGTDLNASVLERLRLEHTNVLWAIDYAMRHDRQEDLVQLVRRMEFFWLGEGLWVEFEHYLELARTLAPRPDDKLHFTNRLLWLFVLREDYDAAHAMRANAELLLGRFDVPYERMRFEDFLGQLFMSQGEPDAAEPHLQRSLALAEELDDRRGRFACNKYLGELRCMERDPVGARTFLEAALEHVGDPSDRQWLRGLAHASQLEGEITRLEGDFVAAETAFRECLRILRFHNDARLQTKALEGLAEALIRQGDTGSAVEALQDCRQLYERLGMWGRTESIDARVASIAAESEAP